MASMESFPPKEEEVEPPCQTTLRTLTEPSTPTAVRTPTPLKIAETEQSITPPTRPSSTPFPQNNPEPENEWPIVRRMSNSGSVAGRHPLSRAYINRDVPSNEVTMAPFSPLSRLPTEIHECILDHLFGFRQSASTMGRSKDLRNWGTVLRHARREEVWKLALVSDNWRELVQERLYRHIKIKGTKESVDQASVWFNDHPHLAPYVKHIEFWFPVFQQRPVNDRATRMPIARGTLIINSPAQEILEGGLTYHSPSNNCALEDVFRFVRITFSEACVLSLEGGERRKPPMVRHLTEDSIYWALPKLETVRTLVIKGQWNLMRTKEDFGAISQALPNLTEWHGAYARPKSKSYLCMAKILPDLPRNITQLNLCLENDFRREAASPAFHKKVASKVHFCAKMAEAMPALEHFGYTGRVCQTFFDDTARRSHSRTTRLKSVHLIVKNVCRPNAPFNDGSGITDMSFIFAFEALVISAVRSLNKLVALESLSIKFIDLDSVIPNWNPYFHLEDNKCTGIWSDQIVDVLARTRPAAAFVEKADYPGLLLHRDARHPPTSSRSRPLSLKVSNYLSLSSGISIS